MRAFVKGTTVTDTRTVDNVVNPEAQAPLLRSTVTGFYLGVTGLAAIGSRAGFSNGAELAFDFRIDNVSLGLQGRAGGSGWGNGDNVASWCMVGGTARYFLSEADTAAFAGASLCFGDMSSYDRMNPGLMLGGSAEVGMAFLRTSRAGLLASLRADLPLTTYYGNYMVPVSFNAGLVLH